jgi:hypothetical protein
MIRHISRNSNLYPIYSNQSIYGFNWKIKFPFFFYRSLLPDTSLKMIICQMERTKYLLKDFESFIICHARTSHLFKYDPMVVLEFNSINALDNKYQIEFLTSIGFVGNHGFESFFGKIEVYIKKSMDLDLDLIIKRNNYLDIQIVI